MKKIIFILACSFFAISISVDASSEIKFIQEYEMFYKLSYKENDDGELETTKKELNSSEYKEQLDNHNQEEKIMNKSNFLPDSFVVTAIHEIEDEGGGTSNNIIKSNLIIEDFYRFYVISIYYPDSGANGKFTFSSKLTWDTIPSQRLIDLVALAYSDEIQIAGKVYSDGTEYIDMTATMSYTQSNVFVGSYNAIYDANLNQIVTGIDVNQYNYNVTEDSLFVPFDLPDNVFSEVINNGYYQLISITYCNFVFKLEATLEPTNSNVIGATLGGSYSHMHVSTTIDWGNFEISSSAPFIKYSTQLFQTNPEYSTIGYMVIFNGL